IEPPGVLLPTGPQVAPPAALLRSLRERREARPHPAVDDRVCAAENGLAIGALALSGASLKRPEDVDAAVAAAGAVLARLGPGGALKRCARGATPEGVVSLEDY